MYVCLCVRVRACVRAHGSGSKHWQLQIFMSQFCVRTPALQHTHLQTYRHAHKHAHTDAHTRTRTRTHTHTHTERETLSLSLSFSLFPFDTRKHTHTRTHTHLHMHGRARPSQKSIVCERFLKKLFYLTKSCHTCECSMSNI